MSAKVGTDDYFVAGGTLDQLLRYSVLLSTFELAQPKRAPQEALYVTTDAGLVWNKRTGEGTVPVLLANFSAVITTDILQDDGIETVRLYELEAVLRGRTSRFTVQAGQFPSLAWIAEQLGASAIVEPGQGLKERLRVAIQTLSTAISSRTEYAHTGWRQIDGTWLYLHAGGAIGPDGPCAGITVTLTGSLNRYALPDPPTGDALLAALRASLALFDLLPFAVAVPLLAATYLAPLREPLGGEPPDFVPWPHGPSGTFKSELAALMQGHFGDFTRQTLPASFAATANALERLLSSAKDALLVVDDYHPASDAREAAAMAQVASRLLRGVGNSAGRTRMRADTSVRPELRPRGVVLVTGERLPEGHSTAARMFPVPVAPGAVDRASLTRAQEQRHLYPAAMAGYLQYLAGRIEDLKRSLPFCFHALRQRAARERGHAREPGQVAHLQLALEVWLDFALESGAISAERRDELLARSWEALLAHAAEHAKDLAEETPVHRFLALLADGFASKRAYLEAPGGGAPAAAEQWGWELRPARDLDDADEVRHLPTATLLGVLTEEWLLLYPEATSQFIQQAARAAGTVFPVELRTLLRRLHEAELIGIEPGSGRLTPMVRIGLRTQRVIKLAHAALTRVSLPVSGEQGEHREHMPPPEPGPARYEDVAGQNSEPTPGNTGNKTQLAQAALECAVPRVPRVPPVPPVPHITGEGDISCPDGRSDDATARSSESRSAVHTLSHLTDSVSQRISGDPPQHVCFACNGTRFYPDGVCRICHPRDWLPDGTNAS